MSSHDVTRWIDQLWPAACARARRPLPGILLPAAAAGEVAEEAFEDFLATFSRPPASREAVVQWLAARVVPRALSETARERLSTGNPDAWRDPERIAWEHNPPFHELVQRTAGDVLASRHWTQVEPILRHRAEPVLARLGVPADDAADVFMESFAELTRARSDAGPLEQMTVFEELPRFFGSMVERRGISWLRKQSARKRQPVHPARTERLDDPDSTLARTLADPASATPGPPWVNAGFDRIRRACGDALTGFEWHLVEALFVEGTHTRLSLASDPWVLEHIGIRASASESKRRRRLNLFIAEALAKLGRQLESCDL